LLAAKRSNRRTPAAEEEAYPERYWFTRERLDRILRMHRFLENRPEVGKVVSVAALDQVAAGLNGGERLSGAMIAGVLGALPEDLRGELIRPYADPQSGQVRLNARIVESGDGFDRAAFAEAIRAYATDELGFARDEVTVTGMMVMFDNMLKQLLTSQVDSLTYVLMATLAMFLILLRSLTYSVLGVLPNVLAAASVIAVMGYAGISLDMMTITIAAIAVGIGVDDAIHYLHRFREERGKGQDVRLSVAWSHATIGRAMYFTTLTIIIGFSVLTLSNFVPTQLFGLLTAAAMALALLANLLLLPSLLVLLLAEPRREAPVGR
jgi:predicted RND superfamily exporter protein